MLFWTIPATVFVIVLRAQLVRTILGSGAFDWEATRLTAAALAIFCHRAVRAKHHAVGVSWLLCRGPHRPAAPVCGGVGSGVGVQRGVFGGGVPHQYVLALLPGEPAARERYPRHDRAGAGAGVCARLDCAGRDGAVLLCARV